MKITKMLLPLMFLIPLSSQALTKEEQDLGCSPINGCTGYFAERSASSGEVAVISQQESLALRLQMIENAKQSIVIQALVFAGDESGLKIAEILKRKRAQGISVQVIVDGVSNLAPSSQRMYYDMMNAGIEIEGYEPMLRQWINEVHLDLTMVNKRFHEKIFLVDAELPTGIAVVGGQNIANEYFRMSPEAVKTWRDQDVVIRGGILQDVRRVFERNFNYFKILKAAKPDLFNPDVWKNQFKGFHQWFGSLRGSDKGDAQIGAKVNVLKYMNVEPKFEPAAMRFIQSRPRFKESYIYREYINQINNAQSEVVIVNAYFVPGHDFSAAVRMAQARGVKVTILTNSPQTNDMPQLTYVGRQFYESLFNGALSLYEWQGQKYGEGTIHAKFAVFDRQRAIVGSYNLDPRSEKLNSESALLIESAPIAERLLSKVEKEDLAKSQQITKEQAVSFKTDDFETKFNAALGMPLKDWL
jgi:putative cardiolipin synthase